MKKKPQHVGIPQKKDTFFKFQISFLFFSVFPKIFSICQSCDLSANDFGVL
ncbi:hypothetical protein RV11_GL003337 [Enterococcus phoeniculicola]|nr:hypothetical protein RV11_GL003337 [Enterococcus phoeniculicola]